MEDQFDGVMQKRTDAELYKILNGDPEDYQPEALESAKREFVRRNLSLEQIVTAKHEIEEAQKLDEDKANMPLGVLPKIIAFLFPGILLLMFAGTYKADGYNRKAKEMVKWTLFGFGFYVGFVVVLLVIAIAFRG